MQYKQNQPEKICIRYASTALLTSFQATKSITIRAVPIVDKFKFVIVAPSKDVSLGNIKEVFKTKEDIYFFNRIRDNNLVSHLHRPFVIQAYY